MSRRLEQKAEDPGSPVPFSGLQVGSHAAKFCRNLNHVRGSGLLSFSARLIFFLVPADFLLTEVAPEAKKTWLGQAEAMNWLRKRCKSMDLRLWWESPFLDSWKGDLMKLDLTQVPSVDILVAGLLPEGEFVSRCCHL